MPQKPGSFEQVITKLSAAVTDAFNRGDVKVCAGFYGHDATLLLPDRPPVKGRDAIEAVLNQYVTSGMKLLPVDTLEVRSSGDIGCVAGIYQFERPSENGLPIREQGKFVTVFMRQADGSWQAVIDSLIRDAP